MKKIVVIFFITIVSTQCFSSGIYKSFSINTNINKNNFFSNTAKILLSDNYLTLNFDGKTGAFFSKKITMSIKTDIPNSSNINKYKIIMSDNESSCYDIDDNIVFDDISIVSIDGHKLDKYDELSFSEFNNESDYKESTHNLDISFKKLPSSVYKCKGSSLFTMEFDI
ncbi:hypothetical protein [Photobacterium damselae]|uniref:hypothetical protein n=1 Tax=Photobacterium damselae TaxID=38293 RepID=UPI00083B3D9E|nr:hypothetical protein [Photobacterium damselae]KAB1181154.1 hypothetical protein F6477_05990 [Photobacterium damselae subsp. damselae]MBF7098715.1 hypothetical protein [Photobacterium damselae]NVO74379.1 hypothetical protein [Photobacterium damselae subsp. damselae]QSH58718.1 hypothetical protein A0J47_018605 [Photobacterium damselae subsp. damselae]SPY29590.1 Uncharacterised protein [Photobacterium damselae]